ncbi:recombinase family protein [Endozoicomonas euniceicola]|uniref:Recombinase family protein n=1 Tax=Endozoicomonas euniceicola TaxID=1234143 RepID=A0ABY6H0R3_9GAMM|nr:recombinase family protein [Endozoicomonas euniceicola]UYM18219.1 recombinase family protein [Endozoicomonas euniceicola]
MTNAVYIRVSSVDQNTDRQYEIVEDGFKVFEDKCSGGSTDRPALKELLNWVREGDTIHVFSIDRLARNLDDLRKLVTDLNDRGIGIKFHKENLSFIPGAADKMNKLMLAMLGAVAEFERDMIRERQAEGIAKAKAKGVYKGRKPSSKRDQIKAMLEAGKGVTAIAKELEVGRTTVYGVKRELEQAA